MTTEDIKALVRRIVEELQNQHDLSAIDRYVSPTFVDHTAFPGTPPDRDGAKMFFKGFFEGVPDLRAEIHEQAAEGNKVFTYKTFHGTHTGTLMGIPATGKAFSVDLIDILAVVDGQITEHWVVMDQLGLLQQLGVVPSQA
ncbi:MAG TPA: ester cyclase [Anaerolineales bacterium]|nr:ester cyclase [Anaerolineales bacterium]